MDATEDRDRFYRIMDYLRRHVVERRLDDCHGRMQWPRRGVYFFFENGETRPDGKTPRVVRVGTHAVSRGSKTTLWNRLSTHRGTAKSGGGNHRGSIFRLHVGSALLRRGDVPAPPDDTWGKGATAPRPVRELEEAVEYVVSRHIRRMPFLWIAANDDAGTSSMRAVVERNTIALLSCVGGAGDNADRSSTMWLGLHSRNEAVRQSSLWNVKHVFDTYDPGYLDLLERLARETQSV